MSAVGNPSTSLEVAAPSKARSSGISWDTVRREIFERGKRPNRTQILLIAIAVVVLLAIIIGAATTHSSQAQAASGLTAEQKAALASSNSALDAAIGRLLINGSFVFTNKTVNGTRLDAASLVELQGQLAPGGASGLQFTNVQTAAPDKCKVDSDCQSCDGLLSKCDSSLGFRCSLPLDPSAAPEHKRCPDTQCNYPYDRPTPPDIQLLFEGFPYIKLEKINPFFNVDKETSFGGLTDLAPSRGFYANMELGGYNFTVFLAFFVATVEVDPKLDMAFRIQFDSIWANGPAYLLKAFPLLSSVQGFNSLQLCNGAIVMSTGPFKRMGFEVVKGANVKFRVRASANSFLDLLEDHVTPSKTYVYTMLARIPSMALANSSVIFAKDPTVQVNTGTDKLVMNHLSSGIDFAASTLLLTSDVEVTLTADIFFLGWMSGRLTPKTFALSGSAYDWKLPQAVADRVDIKRLGFSLTKDINTTYVVDKVEVVAEAVLKLGQVQPHVLVAGTFQGDGTWGFKTYVDLNKKKVDAFPSGVYKSDTNVATCNNTASTFICTCPTASWSPATGSISSNGLTMFGLTATWNNVNKISWSSGSVWTLDAESAGGGVDLGNDFVSVITSVTGVTSSLVTDLIRKLPLPPQLNLFISVASNDVIVDNEWVPNGVRVWVTLGFDQTFPLPQAVMDVLAFLNLGTNSQVRVGVHVPYKEPLLWGIYFQFANSNPDSTKMFQYEQSSIELRPTGGTFQVELQVQFQLNMAGNKDTTGAFRPLKLYAAGLFARTGISLQGGIIGVWKNVGGVKGLDLANAGALVTFVGTEITGGGLWGTIDLGLETRTDFTFIFVPASGRYAADAHITNLSFAAIFAFVKKTSGVDLTILGDVLDMLTQIKIEYLDMTVCPIGFSLPGRIVEAGLKLNASWTWLEAPVHLFAGLVERQVAPAVVINDFQMAFKLENLQLLRLIPFVQFADYVMPFVEAKLSTAPMLKVCAPQTCAPQMCLPQTCLPQTCVSIPFAGQRCTPGACTPGACTPGACTPGLCYDTPLGSNMASVLASIRNQLMNSLVINEVSVTGLSLWDLITSGQFNVFAKVSVAGTSWSATKTVKMEVLTPAKLSVAWDTLAGAVHAALDVGKASGDLLTTVLRNNCDMLLANVCVSLPSVGKLCAVTPC